MEQPRSSPVDLPRFVPFTSCVLSVAAGARVSNIPSPIEAANAKPAEIGRFCPAVSTAEACLHLAGLLFPPAEALPVLGQFSS